MRGGAVRRPRASSCSLGPEMGFKRVACGEGALASLRSIPWVSALNRVTPVLLQCARANSPLLGTPKGLRRGSIAPFSGAPRHARSRVSKPSPQGSGSVVLAGRAAASARSARTVAPVHARRRSVPGGLADSHGHDPSRSGWRLRPGRRARLSRSSRPGRHSPGRWRCERGRHCRRCRGRPGCRRASSAQRASRSCRSAPD
jgi:hypothetical protein